MNVIMWICGCCECYDALFVWDSILAILGKAIWICVIICAYKLIKKILELNHELKKMERNHEYRKEANDKQKK